MTSAAYNPDAIATLQCYQNKVAKRKPAFMNASSAERVHFTPE
jgi:hypothetical protein